MDVPELPVAAPDFDAQLKLMFDLLAVAYQTNVTRIATYMMMPEVSNQPYPHIGVPDAFHPLSHHAENKASMQKLVVVQSYHSEIFAGFLDKLSKMPDGDAGLDARQLDLFVRQQHEQQQQARLVPVADARVRPRRRQDQGATSTCATRITRRSPTCSSR